MSEVAQFCPSLCNPMNCSLPDSSIHGIFLARVLEWVAFHAKMGTIKDRKAKDLREGEDIKKRVTKIHRRIRSSDLIQSNSDLIKDLHDPDNHDGVITHLEPDILECEVKWALGSITMHKAREVTEFQLSYFKS